MRRLTVGLCLVLAIAGCSDALPTAADSPSTTTGSTAATTAPSTTEEVPVDPTNLAACLHVDSALVDAALPAIEPGPGTFGGIDTDVQSALVDAIGALDQDEPDPDDIGVVATGSVSRAIDEIFAALLELDLLRDFSTSWGTRFDAYIDATQELSEECADLGYDGFRWLPEG